MPNPISIDPIEEAKILAGRSAVETYRIAHAKLYEGCWHKGIPEEHTPLLKAMVGSFEAQGFTSIEASFEPKKNEILAKFWLASYDLNVKELGFKDMDDFNKNATEVDKEELEEMWF